MVRLNVASTRWVDEWCGALRVTCDPGGAEGASPGVAIVPGPTPVGNAGIGS